MGLKFGSITGWTLLLSTFAMQACALPSSNSVAAPSQNKSKAPTVKQTIPRSQVPVARDPQIAVQEEFDAAKRGKTVAGWELFIARHPDNTLVPTARAEMARLRSTASGKTKP